MFIRWKHRQCKQWHYSEEPDITHSAYLVQSVRIEGNPRQKVIAFLGSYRQKMLERSHLNRMVRASFWKWCEIRLKQVELSQEEYQAFCDQMARQIPPLSDKESLEHEQQEQERRANAYAIMTALKHGL